MSWGGAGVQNHYLKNPWTPSYGWTGKKPDALPEGFEINKEARYTGVVKAYWKWQGYGFITPTQTGVVPKDHLYVHWSNIQTDDRYPYLEKDMQVEFGLMTWKDKGVQTLRAKYVTMPGGAPVAVQDEADAKNKTFVGGQNLRYTGTLKFYDPQRAIGYVTMDDGFAVDADVPKELMVEEIEVNAGGKRPQVRMEKLAVEFGIYKTKQGKHLVYNMTLPGGSAMLRENVEGRKLLGPETYSGIVQFWNDWSGWGHILPDNMAALPQVVQAKLAEDVAEAQKKAAAKDATATKQALLYFRKQDTKKGSKPAKDMKVSFQAYQDDKGVGACEVAAVEGQ